MRKTLRPYQKQAVEECLLALRKDTNPVLLNSSVGSGKSIMIGTILKHLESQNKRALCLVSSAELVRNNAQTFKDLGGNPSIYCAALSQKCHKNTVVFGTPITVLNAINKGEFERTEFSLIVVDEAHMISSDNHTNSFMQILRHFKSINPKIRVLGATGTPYRFNGIPIVGDEYLFKTQVGNITAAYLIEQGYLVKPTFEIDRSLVIDFSRVKPKSNGMFDNKELQEAIDKNPKLTHLIMQQLQYVMEKQNRFGVFIFCATLKHCEQAFASLPPEHTAVITGSTPQDERTRVLDLARKGKIKYLINVAVLTTGIDVAPFDTVCYCRPTQSLVLFVQTMGRGLRLAPNKKDALILDHAGNLDRFQDWDDPIINEALQPGKENEKDYVIPCLDCGTLNTCYARRCIGIGDNGSRCNNYFEWKDCHSCQTTNDKCARHCRACGVELIDPNAKLSLKSVVAPKLSMEVLTAEYFVHSNTFHAKYLTTQSLYVTESFMVREGITKNIFYGNFLKKQCKNASRHYPNLAYPGYLQKILDSGDILVPTKLECIFKNGQFIIKKRIFDSNSSS